MNATIRGYMTQSFSKLSLAEPLARAVAEMGYESMTPIQALNLLSKLQDNARGSAPAQS